VATGSPTLDGRNARLQDLDAIKLAYGKQD